jgi:hypothetical protein
MTIAPDYRATLRAAINTNKAAQASRAAAAEALKRADDVLKELQAELKRHTAVVSKAETARATEIAAAIKSGSRPAVTLNEQIRKGQLVRTEVESRHRMAEAARDQLAAELTEAEAKAEEAEAAVSWAALDVVIADVETETQPLEELLTKLCAIDDLVFGVARIWAGGGPVNLSSNLRQIIARLQPLRVTIAEVRPQRPILSASSEAATAGRLEQYRAALLCNPDAKLADIATPEIDRPAMPKTNEIEAARIAGKTRIAAA